jgi:hypothetical protein
VIATHDMSRLIRHAQRQLNSAWIQRNRSGLAMSSPAGAGSRAMLPASSATSRGLLQRGVRSMSFWAEAKAQLAQSINTGEFTMTRVQLWNCLTSNQGTACEERRHPLFHRNLSPPRRPLHQTTAKRRTIRDTRLTRAIGAARVCSLIRSEESGHRRAAASRDGEAVDHL